MHRVQDFDAWLKVTDAEGMTKNGGRPDEWGMARGVDDPNVVTVVLFIISDLKKET
jgi:hypothetical protein